MSLCSIVQKRSALNERKSERYVDDEISIPYFQKHNDFKTADLTLDLLS